MKPRKRSKKRAKLTPETRVLGSILDGHRLLELARADFESFFAAWKQTSSMLRYRLALRLGVMTNNQDAIAAFAAMQVELQAQKVWFRVRQLDGREEERDQKKIDELVGHIQRFEYHLFLAAYMKLNVRECIDALTKAGFMERTMPGETEADAERMNTSYMQDVGVAGQVMAIVRWMRDREDMAPLREAKSEVKRLQALVLEHQDERRQKDAAIEYLIEQRDVLITTIGKLLKE